MSQIKIGSGRIEKTPPKESSARSASNSQDSSADFRSRKRLEFSDDFGQTSNLLVSSESPHKVYEKINSFQVLSNLDYR